MSEQNIQQTSTPSSDADTDTSRTTDTKQASALNKTLDDVAEIAALASSVAQQYKEQTALVKQQAKAEWALSVKSLTLAIAILVCFGVGLVMLWASVLTLIGAALFQLFDSLLLTVAVLLVLQVIALIWCWRSMRYLFKQVGLRQTLIQVEQLLGQKQTCSNKSSD
ncbi:hypothetical protein [Rheinheimera sp. WS51]|uniref:hypothetical protein n=1 Tax=Rheinheimera sp. WS51 TaxID=3425886 RepID=UPI003D946D87